MWSFWMKDLLLKLYYNDGFVKSLIELKKKTCVTLFKEFLSLSLSLSLYIYIYIYSIQIEILTILKDKANIYLSLSLLGPKTMQTKSFITSIYKERIMNINKLLGIGILKDKAKIYISHSSLGPKAMQSKSFIPPFIRRE